jgi:predicted peptidase
MNTKPFRPTFLIASLLIVFMSTIASCKKSNDSNDQNNDIPETKKPIETTVTVAVNGNVGGFCQTLPARYDSTTKRYPLLISLHGIGELGNGAGDLTKLINTCIPARIKSGKFPPAFTVNGRSWSFIVIAPQFKNWPSADDVNAVVNYSIAHYRIDTNRIYVTGLSMGGGATWDYAGKYASRIAAIVPICGASGPDDTKARLIASTHLAVWAFHNQDDPTVSVQNSNSIGYVTKINNAKADPQARLTLWPTGGHNAWDKATDPTYKENNMNMYEWMLQFARPAN